MTYCSIEEAWGTSFSNTNSNSNSKSDKKTDFTRYYYFYASYLSSLGKIEEAKNLIRSGLEYSPRNLILNQYIIDLNNLITDLSMDNFMFDLSHDGKSVMVGTTSKILLYRYYTTRQHWCKYDVSQFSAATNETYLSFSMDHDLFRHLFSWKSPLVYCFLQYIWEFIR